MVSKRRNRWLKRWILGFGLLFPATPAMLTAQTGCLPSDEALCLQDGRFQVAVEAISHLGQHTGQALQYSPQDGAFYFFEEGNLELMVKVLDGRGFNNSFWVFYGSLTSLEFELRVTDTSTSTSRLYRQEEGHPVSRFDTSAFPQAEPISHPETPLSRFEPITENAPAPDHSPGSETSCTPAPTNLCLAGDRLKVETYWRGISGTEPEHSVAARSLGEDSGAFWFFDPSNPEVLVKALDGRGNNRSFWVFSAALTDLDYELVVTDTGSGRVQVYPHDGDDLRGLIDTAAFVESANPPLAPVIIEPDIEGRVISGFDVHMETAPMVDPDPLDEHYCSDFEIWTVDTGDQALDELVWRAPCVGGLERAHTHLGDGEWMGSREFLSFLEFSRPHALRIRHRDSTGVWGPWAERRFSTEQFSRPFPMKIHGSDDEPRWTHSSGAAVELPSSQPPAQLSLVSTEGQHFYTWLGSNGHGNQEISGAILEEATPLLVVVENPGGTPLVVQESEISIVDPIAESDLGDGRTTLYLPAIDLPPASSLRLSVSDNGSSFTVGADPAVPEIDNLVRHTPRPWFPKVPGYEVELVASDLRLPVSLAMATSPNPLAGEVLAYVTELYGTVSLIRRDGVVETFVDGLLDFDPNGNFPGSGEIGLTGAALEPSTGDLLVSLVYPLEPGPTPTVFSGRVLRLGVAENGRFDGTIETVFDLAPATMASSHQISNLSFGPDGMLYVHQGDGFQPERSYDLDSFLGKVLRLDATTGQPAPDNPFFDATDGISARDYVFAYGFRNPFGGAWSEELGALYAVENGPWVDRMARIDAGMAYGWDADQDGIGTNEDMETRALYLWGPPAHAPTAMTFVQPGTLGGSGFPSQAQDLGFVTEFGQAFVPGVLTTGKRITAFEFDEHGHLHSEPTAWVEYNGHGRSTLVAIAAGREGLYFAEFFLDLPGLTIPSSRGARLWRLVWTGGAARSTNPSAETFGID